MSTSQQLHKVAAGACRIQWIEDMPSVQLFVHDIETGRKDELRIRVKDLQDLAMSLDKMLEMINDDGDDT